MTAAITSQGGTATSDAGRRPYPWSRRAIGIVLGSERSIAVERISDRMLWILEGPGVASSEDPSLVLAELLERVPRSKGAWNVPTVAIVLGSHLVQCKSLFGLPVVRDVRTASALVQEGAPRFFLRTADDLLTSPAEIDADGGIAAAAFSTSAVRGMCETARAKGLALRAIVPEEALGDDVSPSEDEGVTRAWRAAALASTRAAIRFNALGHGSLMHRSSPARTRRALVAAACATLIALALPIIVATMRGRAASRAHEVLLAEETAALRIATELQAVSRRLLEIEVRRSDRRSVIDLISALSSTLPPGAALTHLQLDSLGGMLIALAPSADAARESIAASRLISGPEVVGPVTRERIGDRELERVSVRFRFPVSPVRGDKR